MEGILGFSPSLCCNFAFFKTFVPSYLVVSDTWSSRLFSVVLKPVSCASFFSLLRHTCHVSSSPNVFFSVTFSVALDVVSCHLPKYVGSLSFKIQKDSFSGCGEIQILLPLSVYI